MLTIFGFWLAVKTAGVQKASLDVHDIFLASGSADVLGYEVWNGQTDITSSISRADGLVAPSHWRAGDGARQWSRVFLGAPSILDASLQFSRASYLFSGEPWSTMRMEK